MPDITGNWDNHPPRREEVIKELIETPVSLGRGPDPAQIAAARRAEESKIEQQLIEVERLERQIKKQLDKQARLDEAQAGYHVTKFDKGELGELSKIREEIDEAIDAEIQGSRIMVLLELSDMMGAVRLYLEKHHEGYALDDLIRMSEITRRAFENGHRG